MHDISAYHAKYFANLLTLQQSAEGTQRLSQSIFDAQIDLNPHQVEAALFAFRSPLSNGVLLADEVGLGKTIEAGLVLCQYWSERRRKLLIIAPASLRKQWSAELKEKFFLDSVIIDGKSFKEEQAKGNRNPFEQDNKIVITSYPFAARHEEYIYLADFDLAVIDEAHKLRNIHRGEKAKTSYAINRALRETKKILLTATPLQNSLLELYGLISILDPYVFGDKKSFQRQFGGTSLGPSELADIKERIRPLVHRTLRKDVLEYVRYTKRIPLVEEFVPSDDEIALYNLVSDFLLEEELYSIPTSQRTLITLVVRKLLASSTSAITGTLETMIKRLRTMLQERRVITQPLGMSDIEEEILDEYIEEEEEGRQLQESEEEQLLAEEEIERIEAEIEQLESFAQIARSIEIDTKVKALLSALEKGFAEQKKLGASQKALIFTESKRTQAFLYDYLTTHGYEGEVVLFNGTNSDPRSKEIYTAWLQKHEGSDIVTGSKSADMKQAIVDYFKDEARIMIATEAGSEGINLQFCNMLINYDLPWNPQRVEQRIGRVHRYGQKHDVVVINFINQKNAADRRVYELLSEKFRLFSGLFGASDEVLGSIASGVDFEKRILKIYQECRNEEEINQAFEALQEEFSHSINARIIETRQKLLEHFDEDVHLRLKTSLHQTQENLDRFSRIFWELSRFELSELADFDEGKKALTLHTPPSAQIPTGRYLLGSKAQTAPHVHSYRLSSPLGQYVLHRAMSRDLPVRKLRFDLSRHPYKISILEALKGKKGYLSAHRLTIDAYDTQEHLILCGITDDLHPLDEETLAKLFSLSALEGKSVSLEESVVWRLEMEYDHRKEEALQANERRNSEHFAKASEKLHRWAEDKLMAIERELKETKKRIKELNRQARTIEDLEEQSKIQQLIREQERKRRRIQKEIFDIEDDIAEERDALIDKLKGAMKQKIARERLFTIAWEII